MAITVDPITYIISVPKDYLTLVQTSPTEIRELSLNAFRLDLKVWEASPEGIVQPITHEHNTEVSLSGITFARVIEILEPYTITFEDGFYAVNLTGANSNVGDRVNVNSVSIRSQNSAGLISSPDIEFSSFNGGVTINVDTGFIGTAYPTGTERRKSNNISDALLIAEYRGFKKIYLDSDIVLGADALLNDFTLQGHSHVDTQVTILPSASVAKVIVTDCNISGTLDGENELWVCIVRDLNYLNGHIHNSSLNGVITLDGAKDAYLANCSQLDVEIVPEVDIGGSGQNLMMVNYSGKLLLTNSDLDAIVNIGLNQGTVILDSTTFLSGTVEISGNGDLTDENGTPILSGIWNDGVIVENRLINRDTLIDAYQLGDGVYVDADNGTSGSDFPFGSKRLPVQTVEEAVIIAAKRGLENIYLLSDYTFPDGTYIQGFVFIGRGTFITTMTFVTESQGCILLGSRFKDATLTGNISGIGSAADCLLSSLGSIGLIPSSAGLLIDRTLFEGTTTLPSNYSGEIVVRNSYSNVVGVDTPVFDNGNSLANTQFRNYTGGILLKNVTQGNTIGVDLMSGQVKLDPSTVTNATIVVRGSGKVVNADTGEYIYSGLWNGGVTILAEANTPEHTARRVWDENVADHLNLNSTGEALLDLSYNKTIFIDTINGEAGQNYPLGMRDAPSNNLADALVMLIKYNLHKIHIIGSLTINDGEDLSGYTFTADRSTGNTLTITNAITNFTYIENLTCFITQNGTMRYTTSVLVDIANFDGGAKDCLLISDMNIVGTGSNYLTNCDTYINDNNAFVNLDVGANKLNIIRGRGNFNILNKTDATYELALDLAAGQIKVDSTCTAGKISASGVLTVIDNSSAGCEVIDRTLTNETISSATWDQLVIDHLNADSFGEAIFELLNAGGSLTPTQATQLEELHKLQGLKLGSPMTVTPTSRTVDGIDIELSGDGENSTTVTRK